MKSIGVKELLKNFDEKLENINTQGETVSKQSEDFSNKVNDLYRLKWKIEGGKEMLGALISEFQPEAEKIKEEKVEDKKE